MPILTNEREPRRGRRSWMPAVLAGVPALLLIVLFLLALLMPLDEPLILPLGGPNGPVLTGADAHPPPGVPAARPRRYAYAYNRKMRSGGTMEVHGVCLGYRLWAVMQPRR